MENKKDKLADDSGVGGAERSVSQSGVAENLSQMKEGLGPVAENEDFLFDNAAANPAGEAAAKPVEGTNYSKKLD